MVAFIVLFLPAVLSVWIWETISKIQLKKKNWFYLLALNIMLVNAVCFAVKKWILFTASHTLSDLAPSGALNYLIMAIPVAIGLAVVENFVFHKVQLRVEDRENPEDSDEKTKT